MRGGSGAAALRSLTPLHLPQRVALACLARPDQLAHLHLGRFGVHRRGLRALTSRTHHLGPVEINTQRAWSSEQARPEIGLKWEKMNRE